MDRSEILRYMRTSSKTDDEQILSLIDRAQAKLEGGIRPKTLYKVFDCEVSENDVTVGGMRFESKKLAQNMQGCKRAVVFGATLGAECDRMIKSASSSDIALAMALQACAAAKIEEICDGLEDIMKSEHGFNLTSRYSPGYFDLDITSQRALFSLIDITKRIGITLTDTCEMAPTKSVTAIIGIIDKE